MDSEIVDEIIACLPQDRTLLHYYRDRYAVYMLAKLMQEKGIPNIADLKKTAVGKYLDKPIIKKVLGHWGAKTISEQILSQCWPTEQESPIETYRLSLGKWGDRRAINDDWQQTTRRGSNLVLHLNFCNKHDRDFKAQTGVEEWQSFNYWGHPSSDKYRNTLAWARLDIDFESNTVLIEEIQTDWLRKVTWAAKWIRKTKQREKTVRVYDIECRGSGLLSYQRQILTQHEKVWSEAMLFASIWFIHQELGIKNIYYHTVKTGAILKGVSCGLPPKSLYSDLPRKFCFKETEEAPELLRSCSKARRRIKKVKQPTWFKLAV